MIADVRTYTIVPRRMNEYVGLFEAHGLPVAQRHGLTLAGYFISQIGALNQVVHIWTYDSLADFEAKRAARDADPAWGAYLAKTAGMVTAQEDKVMRPASFSPIR